VQRLIKNVKFLDSKSLSNYEWNDNTYRYRRLNELGLYQAEAEYSINWITRNGKLSKVFVYGNIFLIKRKNLSYNYKIFP
jgi:hypothetical protein